MIQVLPSLLSQTEEEFRTKLGQVKDLVDMVHVDVMDGQFVPDHCWADPSIAKQLLSPPTFGVHLMVKEPDEELKVWSDAGAERLEVHIEALVNPCVTIRRIHELGCEAGLVLNPATPVERIIPFLEKIDFVLIMGVTPGLGGQSFITEVLPKIKKLRDARLDLSIGVDGGVNEHTAREIIAAGADTLITGNYLFKGEGLADRLSFLRNL